MDKTPAESSNNKLYKVLFIAVLVLGLALRFYQYLMGRSLWEDETHLALNIMKYGYLRLLKPLDDIQAAPILFLYFTKTLGKIFGYTELALRGVPFITSILTLPLFYYIVFELTKKRAVAIIAFFVFAVNVAVLYFSSELKAYGVDVAVYLSLVFFTISSNEYVAKNRHLILSILGCLALLLSSVSFIVLFCIGLYKLMAWKEQKKVNKADVKMFALWAVVFVLNYFFFIYHHPSTEGQRLNYAFAFCPTNIFSHEFRMFMSKTIEETFFTMLLYVSKDFGFAFVLLLVFVVALSYIVIKKQWVIFLFICMPILMHLGLSALKLYPFWFRLILYLVPCFIFLISLGTYLVAKFLADKTHKYVGVCFAVFCCFFFTRNSFANFPLWPREIKPTLDWVNKYPNTHVYVTDPINAYTYYYKRGYVKDSAELSLPWDMKTDEYLEFVSSEKSNYLLFYGTVYQWGYADVLKDLERQNLILRKFESRGYGVALVKPLKMPDPNLTKIDYRYFENATVLPGGRMIAIWGGEVVSRPIPFASGSYNATIVSKGSPLKGVFPHMDVFINGSKIGEYFCTADLGKASFKFDLPKDTTVSIRILMDNDSSANGEDRNAFISKILVEKLK